MTIIELFNLLSFESFSNRSKLYESINFFE